MRLDVLKEADRQRAIREAERIDLARLERRLREHVDGEVRFDTGSRALYATDASNYRQVPIGVVVPRNIEALIAAVGVCHDHGAPITSRGAGTGLVGNACNVAVILDCSKHLNQILDIDPHTRTARVQPGVILDHLRNRAQRDHGLTFAPDPSTHAYCTLGGMIGNNACGVHSLMSCRTHRLGDRTITGGRTSDCVEAMNVLTYDGERLTVGDTSDEDFQQLANQPGRRGDIYRGLRDLRDQYADLIRQRYPAIPRRVSGYNLDDLLPENDGNVARALVGSEGTCVTILDATVSLVPHPAHRILLVIGYPSVFEAGDDVPRLLEFDPVGLEGIDDHLLYYMQVKGQHPRDVQMLPDGGGWLMVEFGGGTQEEADQKARDCIKALEGEPGIVDMKMFDDPEQAEHIWKVREGGLGATAFVPGMADTWPGWEDAAVDPARVGDYLRAFRKLLDQYGYACALYGHFGQGCIHCRIDFDLTHHDGIDTYRRFLDDAADLVVEHGGSFTAEHGDGQSKAALLPKMFGPELMDAMRQFKSIWDPHWKMNPGKVIDPNPITSGLRLGEDYEPATPRTHYQFPDDEFSLSRAALRCVGVGKCRRTEEAFMCPSFLVTREEKDTTRGRARVLFEMLRGETITDGWRSEEVMDALDLCLSCKGCKDECPVDVDMATYKSEFLSHYYEGRLRPRAAYAMGLIGTWAKLASFAPRLANFVGQTPALNRLAKLAAGVAQPRALPHFADEPFTDWHRRNRLIPRRTFGREIVLYPDAFNNYFHPGTLRAALEVLEHLGDRVVLPEHEPPCIRPTLHNGMLDLAKRQLQQTIALLRDHARHDTPIVGLEPSTVAVFRDELRNLFPHDQDGQRLARNTYLFSEFLRDEGVELPSLSGRRAIFHGHCHQKAVLHVDAARELLLRMGLDVDEPEPGCCGMAGSFGFEAEHYDVSVAIGERHLHPTIRAADPTTYILAEGFSCRAQIAEGTNRPPLHLAELIHMAMTTAPPDEPYPERPYLATTQSAPPPRTTTALPAITLGLATIGLAALLVRRFHRSR